MPLRRIIALLLAVAAGMAAKASTYSYRFDSTPLVEALVKIISDHPETRISFIFNDLETYRTSARVEANDLYTALRQLTDRNPVRVISHRGVYFVEALQHGRFRFTGRTVGSDGEPVVAATVMLLSPADSTVITYGVTDSEGRFAIPCDRPAVVIKASSLGYEPTLAMVTDKEAGDIVMPTRPIRLRGVSVQPQLTKATPDKSVFVPTRREKNASHGGADLLMVMAIPSVYVDPLNNSISAFGGGVVSTYIDYLPASATEVADIRPQDVRRVEIYDYPDDPRFGNALHVVNFVMVQYVYGGYTKGRAAQGFISSEESYGANSRFTYRRMTYDLAAGHVGHRTCAAGYRTTAEYDFPDGTVTQTGETQSSLSRDAKEYINIRAKYLTDRLMLSNTAGLNFSHPRKNSLERTDYSSPLYPSGVFEHERTDRNLSAAWSGVCNLRLTGSLMLSIRPDATYARNHSHASTDYPDHPILNNVTESAWRTTLWTELDKSFGRHSTSVAVKGELQRNRLDYTGSSPATVDYNYRFMGLFLSGRLNFGKIWIQPSVRIFITSTDFGAQHVSEYSPGFFVAAGWSPDQHHRLTAASQLFQTTVPITDRSPNLVLRSPIAAVQGDPELRADLSTTTNARYEWLPSNSLSLAAYSVFNHTSRPISPMFSPDVINGRPVMIAGNRREGGFCQLDCGVAATLKLMGNSLVVRASLSDSRIWRTGQQHFTANFLHPDLQANYYLGSLYFNAQFRFPRRDAGIYHRNSRTPPLLYLRAGWSRGALNLSLAASNPFTSGRDSGWATVVTPDYRLTAQNYGPEYHRRFTLSVSYSIAYGRRLKAADDLGSATGLPSAIVR